MRILLIEDEPLIALDAEMSLIAAGHEVIGPYKTSKEALDAADRERPDIAMVDINLAGHNEGLGIVRDLYDRFGIRSVFATGQPDLARANAKTALGVLPKPYSSADLVNTFPVLELMLSGGAPPPPVFRQACSFFADNMPRCAWTGTLSHAHLLLSA
jgi:DNA-binding NarL/FixJ family response regulator